MIARAREGRPHERVMRSRAEVEPAESARPPCGLPEDDPFWSQRVLPEDDAYWPTMPMKSNKSLTNLSIKFG